MRAAVVIGVNKTGDLPVLNDAAPSAGRIASWLRREGYQVTSLLDSDGAVTVSKVLAAVEEICDSGRCEQLVIYFAGHGYLNDGSELWLLSNAPTNPNEAIGLELSVRLARSSGIPNVTFISDACRSVPQSLTADTVRGGAIFPNRGAALNELARIDRFFACRPGSQAYEVSVDKSSRIYRALFSDMLIDAFVNTPASECENIAGIEVLTNQQLAMVLPKKVDDAITKTAINLYQRPDAIIESRVGTYIAKVVRDAQFETSSTKETATGQLTRKSTPEGERIIQAQLAPEEPDEIARWLGILATPENAVARDDAVTREITADHVGRFMALKGPGVVVRGVRVTGALGLGCDAKIDNGSFQVDGTSYVRLGNFSNARYGPAVLIRFEDRSGTILYVPRTSVCLVIVDYSEKCELRRRGVAHLGLYPSLLLDRLNQPGWGETEELRELRAIFARSVNANALRLDKWHLGQFVDKVLPACRVDPMVGLYAAYICDNAGYVTGLDEIRSVLEKSRAIFATSALPSDVALLATRDTRLYTFAPFSPLLSQGWTRLSALDWRMPDYVSEAGKHRRASSWTTFDPMGLEIIWKGLEAEAKSTVRV